MADRKTAKRVEVGSVIELPSSPCEVVPPDSVPVQVTGGAYVLDRPGVHIAGGVEYTAK